MSINYARGDATKPNGSGPRLILHCANDAGLWGKGFVLALSKRWPFAEEAYRAWAAMEKSNICESIKPEWIDRVCTTGPLQLGEVQLVLVAPKLWIANLIGQHGIEMWPDNRPPIRYDAIQHGLQKVYRYVQIHSASVHMPRMGSGLAGGNWSAVEKLVQVELATKGVSVTVYDLP